MVHVVWECPVYDSIRNTFMVDLQNLLGESFEEFKALDSLIGQVLGLGYENYDK